MPRVFSHSATPVAPPPVSAAMAPARVRLYDSAFLAGGISRRQVVTVGDRGIVTSQENMWDATGAGYTGITGSLPGAPLAGSTLVAFLFWDAVATDIDPPAGWTEATTATSGATLTGRVFLRQTVAGESAALDFPFSTSSTYVNWGARVIEYVGTSATPLDKTATATGTGTALSTGTTAATASAEELALAFFAGRVGVRTNITLGPGYLPVGPLQAQGVNQGVMGQRSLNMTGTQSATATQDDGLPWLGMIVTLIAAPTPRFDALAELDACTGTATRNPFELGTLELTIPVADPASGFIREGVLCEVWVPDPVPWTFETYRIEKISRDDGDAAPVLVCSGLDLRVLIAERTIAAASIDTIRGAPPASKAVENWVRAYVDKAAITIGASQGYPTADVVPGLVLETTSGNRGTVYTEPPAKAGVNLVETIAQLYRRDSLGWRLVLVDPGTPTATVRFETYSGVDRTFGTDDAAVFAVKFDTARRVRHISSGLGGLTALTALGPAVGNIRSSYYVEDATAKQLWGLRHGFVDASNEQYPTEEMARALLNERLPKQWAEVEARSTDVLRFHEHYDLLDKVTALTRDGLRLDGAITQASLAIGAHDPAGSTFGELAGVGAPPTTVPVQTQPAASPLMRLVVGDVARSEAGGTEGGIANRDSAPSAVREYSYHTTKAAIADTSGASLATIETSLNAVKAVLRSLDVRIIAP